VLLKGPTTVVASPDGRVLLANAGDQRLATGGTGDVLSGVLAAFCARGVPAFEAAAAAAHVHGLAGTLGPTDGLVADDLLGLLPSALAMVFDA
jgi:NAD(P)H-hydrate epimerase